MELRVPPYNLVEDVVLLLALSYIWWFFFRRWNRYVAELKPFVRHATIFLGIAVVGRAIDVVDDFCTVPHASAIFALCYGVSILGIIYTMINYVVTLESSYLPVVERSTIADNSKKSLGARIIWEEKATSKSVVELLKELETPTLVFTRSPQVYNKLGDFVAVKWVTYSTDSGVSPMNLHVMQDFALNFAREHKNALIVIDCLEYLLLYNDFSGIFKFLTHLKDDLLLLRASLLIVANEKAVGEKNCKLLLREFELL